MWTYHETAMNCLSIFKAGNEMAQILSGDDSLTQDDKDIAQFIIDACNEKEERS